MHHRLRTLSAAALLVGALATACSSGGGGREIEIVATEQACTPATATAKPGEKLTLEVSNQAKSDREVEGIEGTKLEEVLIPAGRVRKLNFTMPASGTAKIKCYIPGGPTTIIEITPGGA